MIAFSEETKENLINIYDNYGAINQTVKLMEECAELVQALAKMLSSTDANDAVKDKIITEIADVLIMIEELLLGTGWRDKVEAEADYKVHRQLQRMEAEHEER